MQTKNYSGICIEILKAAGPLLGSELQEQLVLKTNIKPNNARQVLLRLRKDKILLTTDPVRFSQNQLLYFLPKQNLNSKIKEIMPDHRETFHRIFQAFVELQGFLHLREFSKICAGVVNKAEKEKMGLKQKEVYQIIDELLKLNIIEPLYDFGGEQFIVAKKEWVSTVNIDESNLQKRLKDLEFTDDFTGSLLEWLERMNFAGANSTHLLQGKSYNGFSWDAIGYSYLWGLYKANEPNAFQPSEDKIPSVIVIESILHRVMRRFDVTGFISRISVIYGRLKVKDNFRILPVCFVQSINEDALKLARQRGIMVISISEVFGTKIADALKMVRDLDPRKIDPEALAKVLAASDASGHDGKFGSLKGYVFNFLVASVFNNQGYNSRIGWKYEALGRKCECDITASVDDDYLIVCETKGYNEGTQVELGETENDKDSVRKFFEKTCEIIGKSTGKRILPVFVTSGNFSTDAIEYMQEYEKRKIFKDFLKMRNFPSTLYFDRKKLLDLFGNSRMYTEHRKIMKEFFRDHKRDK
ncbi:hypothetical protein DUZ99_15600 [Xylanibacillus composti]|uniref:Uncharacterized protein n=1 Tax=Xylanibacillus composti TaxID=1572762 RepID=A0A8J4H954_9BACL|nr:hypothetical protein [Xylanibacillus composti]MDT9726408.1 hypothetical protein [Xylanibacillus composti]GIQ71498.1 hypothetical protein XYCOK13_43220 [Xylanibacillus composti]